MRQTSNHRVGFFDGSWRFFDTKGCVNWPQDPPRALINLGRGLPKIVTPMPTGNCGLSRQIRCPGCCCIEHSSAVRRTFSASHLRQLYKVTKVFGNLQSWSWSVRKDCFIFGCKVLLHGSEIPLFPIPHLSSLYETWSSLDEIFWLPL